MKSVIYIEGRRNGYSPKQCGQTMTVKELKELLSEFPEDAEIFINNDNGYTYGNIDEWSFTEDELEDDKEEEDEEK